MRMTNGLLLRRENNSLLIYNPKQQNEIKLGLNKPWVYFPFSKVKYLTPIRIINPFLLQEYEYETTPDTLIILNPDILINARSIATACDCYRRSFIEYILGEAEISLPMIRGSIIHEAFFNIVSHDLPVLKAFETSWKKFSFALSYLSVDQEELAEDIIPVLKGLNQSVLTLQNENIIPEMTFLSPLYGIFGRIDYWSPNELYELKSGRRIPSKETNTWFSDLIQTVVYMHGLSSTPKAVSKSYVIYSGSGQPAFRQTTLNLKLLQQIHLARNYCYVVQFEGFIPPENQVSKCNKCFKLDSCKYIFNIFNEERKTSSISFHYLNHFLSLIRLEHLKNRQDLSYLWKLTPIGRIKTGKAINNLRLIKKKDDISEYFCRNSSELRRGEPVLVSMGDPVVNTTTMAKIFDIERKRVLLSSQNQLPKEIFLDSYSSDFNFQRLNKNIFEISFGFKKSHKSHKFVILGKKPSFTSNYFSGLAGLDQSQHDAIQLVLNAIDYCLIQGPAGTGKTYTIAKLIELLRNEGQRILLTAYTNTAVDNMIKEYLEQTKSKNARKEIIRLGIVQAIDQTLVDLTIENLQLDYQELEKKPIVATTTTTISRNIYDLLSFDTVIVDEASQMAEPYILSAITKGKRFILVGDDKQLPPLVLSSQSHKLGLNISLFERLRKLHPEASVLLRFQYRMHDSLMEFSNQKFYEEKVKAASPKIAKQLLWDILPLDSDIKVDNPLLQTILDPNQPLVYVGVNGSFNKKKRINSKESEIICQIISNYLRFGIKKHHIGVITPFRGQVAEITRHLGKDSGILVDTIDRFQGSDKELIILSLCTLTRPHILEDERRLNVALTRAKKKLIILGNIPTPESINLFQELYSFISINHSTVIIDQEVINDYDTESEKKKEPKMKIESDFSYSSLVQNDISEEYSIKIEHKICVLCQAPVNEKIILRCPVCRQAYHEEHLRNWLESNEVCVICQTNIQLI